MYKNFTLTESERERILGMHKERGYKKPLNEQSYNDDMEMDDENDLYPSFDGDGKFIGMTKPMSFVDDDNDLHRTFDGDGKFIGMSKSMDDMEPDSYEMDELEEIDMAQPSDDETKVEKLLNYFGFKKYKVLHDGDLVVYDNGHDTYNLEVRLFKYQGELFGKILYHGPAFGNPNEMEDKVLTKENIPVKVGDDRFPIALEKALKMVKSIKGYNESKPLREGWRDIFGAPDTKDVARSAYKSQGHSLMGSDDEQRAGEFYMVFNGEKFFPNQMEYANYQDMGELPRVENGVLIVPNPAWES